MSRDDAIQDLLADVIDVLGSGTRSLRERIEAAVAPLLTLRAEDFSKRELGREWTSIRDSITAVNGSVAETISLLSDEEIAALEHKILCLEFAMSSDI